jgi:3-hydroxyacyl-[acyl-carrier-protein] dehydratase
VKLDFTEIRGVLPHRFPMLLLDRVDDLEPGVRLTARKAVSGNEPCYRDASGDAYPPMLLVESWCQAAGVLAVLADPGRVLLLGALGGVRFHGGVYPGDVVEHRVALDRSTGDRAILSGQSLVDGRVVLDVDRAVVAIAGGAT